MRKESEQIKLRMTIQIQDLRRQLVTKKAYDEEEAEKEISRLKKELRFQSQGKSKKFSTHQQPPHKENHEDHHNNIGNKYGTTAPNVQKSGGDLHQSLKQQELFTGKNMFNMGSDNLSMSDQQYALHSDFS